MKTEELAVVCGYIASNWPAAAMTTGTIDIYQLELNSLAVNEVIATLREDFADADFPPPPMKLRNAVLRRTRPQLTYEMAMEELLNKIASVGRYADEPAWSSPVIAEIVKQRGGWWEVCASTPARQALDATGLNVFNTWSAQFRDHFRVVAARHDREATHAALGTGAKQLQNP